MNKLFATVLLCACSFANAQTAVSPVPGAQPYGKVSIADLEMKSCDFEKDANAEVLFDVGKFELGTGFVRHLRIKIFNDFGKQAASIHLDGMDGVVGETINLEDGKIVITPIDKKLIYIEKTDRFHSASVFAFPNVKAGSIIEFTCKSPSAGEWYFQNNFPTRYSEITTVLDGIIGVSFKIIPHVQQPYVKDVGSNTDFKQIRALANVHSLPDEPYMSNRQNNLQRIEFLGTINVYDTWPKIGDLLLRVFNKDQYIDAPFVGEKEILTQAKSLKTDDEKIAFIFDQVKSAMQWNGITSMFPTYSADKVWDTKTGNSAEINWMVYHLLKKAGIKAFPFIIGSKYDSKLNPLLPSIVAMAKMVVYIPVDSTKNYLLDATEKFNQFNLIPKEELNTFGMNIYDDSENKMFEVNFIENKIPSLKTAFLNAEIKPDGKITGTEEITSYDYNKMDVLEKYKKDGKEKYIDYLRNNDNSIKVSDFKLENSEVDSLPLSQKINFNIDLASADENYIYFKANAFNLVEENPFIKEERYSDIDFRYMDRYAVSNIYKLPAGFKIDALPQSVTIVLPDESMTFKRTVAEDSGTLFIKYSLNRKKTIYFKKDYQDLRGFYKKMYELLNEQVILKKA